MLPIGEIVKRSQVPASTLRYYEKIGLLPEVDRSGGQRRYPPDILNRIRVIRMAQQAGFQVSEILTLLEGFDPRMIPSKRWRELAMRKRIELAEKRKQLEAMLFMLDNGLSCNCLSWDECFDHVGADGTCCKGS